MTDGKNHSISGFESKHESEEISNCGQLGLTQISVTMNNERLISLYLFVEPKFWMILSSSSEPRISTAFSSLCSVTQKLPWQNL